MRVCVVSSQDESSSELNERKIVEDDKRNVGEVFEMDVQHEAE